MTKVLMCICCALLLHTSIHAQELSATEIIQKATENKQGESLYSEVKMTIIRPTWTREVGLKTWAKGEKYSLAVVTSPAKDRGQAFLKREKDLWNWIPSIDRMVKMSSSVMGQSWMGSDFTNDDIIRQASKIEDFKHTLEKTEKIREFDCYKIVLIPNEHTAVVWGKIIVWISKTDFIEVKSEFYDEDQVLVNTYNAYDLKKFGDKKIPSRIEVIPADKPDQKTVLTILKNEINKPINDSFFSQQNMKKVR